MDLLMHKLSMLQSLRYLGMMVSGMRQIVFLEVMHNLWIKSALLFHQKPLIVSSLQIVIVRDFVAMKSLWSLIHRYLRQGKFDPQISQARNAYFYFDRKRNYNAWDDDGDIPTKAIYNGYTGHTNSSGPQMEGGWLEPDFQWIRIKNPLEEPIHLVITARFKY